MSDGFDSNTKAIGLYRHPNNLNSPDGSLLAADECVITRENQIDRRRGFSLCNTGLPLATPKQLFVSNGTLFANIDDKLYYESGDCTWTLADHISAVGAYVRNLYWDTNLLYYVEYPPVAQSLHSISTFNLTNSFISVFSGNATNTNSTYPYPVAANGSAYVSQYSGPYGFTVQGNYLYVADSGSSTVRRVDKVTGTSTTFAGIINTTGVADGIGAAARFQSVQAICSDSTYLWLIDVQPLLGLVGLPGLSCNFRKVEIATQTVTTVTSPAYYGNPGHTKGFVGYCGWTTDAHDYCYFSHRAFGRVGASTFLDLIAYSIVRANKTTGVIDQNWSGVWDTSGYADGTAANSRYSVINGLWGDTSDGYLYVCADNVIRKVSLTDGSTSTWAGDNANPGYQDGIGIAATFTGLAAIWGNSTYIYVADQKTIRRITRSTVQVTTVANVSGSGSGGYVSYNIDGPT